MNAAESAALLAALAGGALFLLAVPDGWKAASSLKHDDGGQNGPQPQPLIGAPPGWRR
ncbi:MAG: hypothetical protein ABR508_07480 [Candidatus Baltobacteraceae bacterium]